MTAGATAPAAPPTGHRRGPREWLSRLRRLPHLSLGWRRLLPALAILTVLVVFVGSEAGHTAMLRLLDSVEHGMARHPGSAGLIVVLLSALAAMLAFLSSWVVVPFAVYTWGPWRTLLLLLTGWLLGGAVSYAIGRFLGRPVVRWLGLPALLTRYEEWVSRRTPFGIALLLQLALPSEVRGYLFGLGRYPFAPYLVTLALAELPFAVATVYLGAGVLERRASLVVSLGAGLIVLSAWAFYALRRRLADERRRLRAAESAATGD